MICSDSYIEKPQKKITKGEITKGGSIQQQIDSEATAGLGGVVASVFDS